MADAAPQPARAGAPLLEATGISKAFFGVPALTDVDLRIERGEVMALLGENGAGKSTLVKILTGAYRMDAGAIRLENESVQPRTVAEAQTLGIGTVYQEVNLLPNLSVAENVYLGRQPRTRLGLVDGRRMERDARALLSRYGLAIDPGALLGSYSVAVQQIVAIARAVDLSGKILVLDEPTASLDARETAMLFDVVRQLKREGLGIVVITHFLDQVFAIADRVTVLRNGRLVGSKPIGELDRLSLITMMLGRELKEETLGRSGGESAVATEPLVSFRGYGKRGSIEPFDLDIGRGEVVGIAGLLGSGRTETARLAFGADKPDSGTLTVEGRTVGVASPEAAVAQGFAFCPEERKVDGIVADLSVRENIVLALQARRGWMKPLPRAEQIAIADRYIKALDIRTAHRDLPIKFLSGGNQQKAILARWLATDPRFLILDEPTRGIDVGAHAEIIRLIEDLRARGLSLLVVSSELEELVAYASRVVVLADHRHVAELSGDEMNPSAIMAAIARPHGAPTSTGEGAPA
jgi:galactofuranose transport system ATP-binding protein